MNWFWKKSSSRMTSHKCGGLIPTSRTGRRLSKPAGWVSPAYVDSRPYCTPTDDQGQTSQCACYTIAKVAEVYDWISTHVPVEHDPDPLYKKAKELDKDNMDGTTLLQAFEASRHLGLFRGDIEAQELGNADDVRFALHRNRVVMLGFFCTEGWNYADMSTGYVGDSSRIIGGHAVCGCYYDKDSIGWQNSWGKNWGTNGFGRMTWSQFESQFLGGLAICQRA